MPLCTSGRHFQVDAHEAARCCDFKLGDTALLKSEKIRFEDLIAETSAQIEEAKGKVRSLRDSRDGFQARVEDYKAARMAKILNGEQPITDPGHAFLIQDIEGLDAVIKTQNEALEALIRKNDEHTEHLAGIVGEIGRIARHAALKKIHAQMLEVAKTWNECAGGVLKLRLRAHDSRSSLNGGEYPLMPPALLCIPDESHQPEFKILGLRPWPNH